MKIVRGLSMCLIAGMWAWLTGCNLNELPENIYLPNYEGRIATVLFRDTLSAKDFITKNNLHSDLPRSASFEHKIFHFQSTAQFSLDHMAPLKESENLTLIFNTVNEFPFSAEVDLIFVNGNGQPTDSITNIVLFESPVDSADKSRDKDSVSTTSQIILSPERVAVLNNASSLKLVTRLSSPVYQYQELISLFSDHSLIMSLSASGQVSINLNN